MFYMQVIGGKLLCSSRKEWEKVDEQDSSLNNLIFDNYQ